MSNEMMNQTSLFDDALDLFDGMEPIAKEETKAVTEGMTPAKETKAVKGKAAGRKGGKTTKLQAPVSVIGCGWRYTYEGEGEVTPVDVLKAVYAAGYTEVALARVYTGEDPSVLYVNALEAGATPDDRKVAFQAGKIEIALGMQKTAYAASDFTGMEEADISVLDLSEKYAEARPEFSDFSLRVEEGIAIPVTDAESDTPDGDIQVWRDGTVQRMSAGDFQLAYDVQDKKVTRRLYKLSNGAYIVGYTGTHVPTSLSDFNVNTGSTDTVEEKYKLPLTICLANFNKNVPVTPEHFSGKQSVTREDVLSTLKRSYKLFSQKDRKVDWVYDKAHGVLSVAVVSGKKGSAAVIPFPVLVENNVRIERTGIGNFYGYLDENGEICEVEFEMTLPKIPMHILTDIIRDFKEDLDNEAYAIIRWSIFERKYAVFRPRQDRTKVSVNYLAKPQRGMLEVMQIHSHNTMAADWSKTDDIDECGIGLFGVIGRLNGTPDVRIRAGMEGCFAPLDVSDLFGKEG